MQAGDKLWVQINVLDPNESFTLCDGNDLGLTQNPTNCITGMGTRVMFDIDGSLTTSASPQFGGVNGQLQYGHGYNPTSGVFLPQNQMPYDSNPSGRTLYFLDQNVMTTPAEKKNGTLVFDIILPSNANDDEILVKGTGSENMSNIAQDVPGLMDFSGERYKWYVSAYQHLSLIHI